MPTYEITSPDGRTFEVTAPDGATPDQVMEYAKRSMGTSGVNDAAASNAPIKRPSVPASTPMPQKIEPKVKKRGIVLPLAEMTDGKTVLALPEILNVPYQGFARMIDKAYDQQQRGVSPLSERFTPQDAGRAFEASGAALTGPLVRGGPVVARPPSVPRVNPSLAQRAQEATDDLGAFERLGVRPFGPAFSEGPSAAVGKQLSELPLVGAPVRNALTESLEGAGTAASGVAGRYGTIQTPHEAGIVAQKGIERFKDARPSDILDDVARKMSDTDLSKYIVAPTRDSSLKSKQSVLYEKAWREIPEEMRLGRAVEGDPRVMQSPAATREVLRSIIERNSRMVQMSGDGAAKANVTMPASGGLLGAMFSAINNPRWNASLQTLREMRSSIRRLASGMPDTEKNTLSLSDLKRFEGAITQDMVALLRRNADTYKKAGDLAKAQGFERAITRFAKADRYTRLSAERLETIERLFGANNAEALARTITNAAKSKGRGNLAMLRTLSRTLRGDEMSDIAGVVINELGKPVGSARGVAERTGFSVSSFMTNYNNMAPEARDILFSGEHRKALDDLVRVVDRLANVEGLANTSRSFTNAVGITGLAGAGGAMAGGVDAMLSAGAAASALLGASVIFSRPEYARWAVKYVRLKAAGTGGTKRLARHVEQLAKWADSDPALAAVYAGVRSEVVGQDE